MEPNELKDNMHDLFETIISSIPEPKGDESGSPQMLISTIDYNEYIGRIGIGKIERGTLKVGSDLYIVNDLHPEDGYKIKIGKLYEYMGLNRVEVSSAGVGNIVAVSGIDGINIGDTITDVESKESLPFVKISEPTIAMTFSVNDSPLAGREGRYVTSRQIKDRLEKELKTNISLRVEETETADAFKVSGRGELHLTILMETMRREGYELQVSKPEVLYKKAEDGSMLEPMERAIVDVPDQYMGAVIEKLASRKGEMQSMTQSTGGYARVEFIIPTRGLIGYRAEFLTDTKGEGILNTLFEGYQPYKGDIITRNQGSLVAWETGTAVTYGLYNAQERGILFIGPGQEVYQGMVVGRHAKSGDLDINVNKRKQVTNMRASGTDESMRLSPPKIMSLEETIEFIGNDELAELTPKSIRIRKKVLDKTQRAKTRNK